MTDIERAYEAIKNKRETYDSLYSYYDGHPVLKYSTQRIARAFNNSLAYFAENWAGVIINAVLDRLVLKGFDASNDSINIKIDELFNRLNLNLDAKDIHESLQVTGEAFLIVDVVDGETDVYFNDPRLCHMEYNPDRPKVKSFAAKEWIGEDGKTYINLYYPDRTEKYVSDNGDTAKSFTQIDSTPNPTGVIPVFHFKNSRRIVKGELDDSTLSMLDAINKLFSDLMVAAEFETFKTKVFISQVDPGDIKMGPDMKLWLPANESTGEDTKVLELGGSNLENFLKPITQLAESLAIQTRTPKNLFMALGANISGEALVVEEASLVKKVLSKEEAYSPTWSEFAAYLLKLNGITVDSTKLIPVWEKPETKLPLTEAMVIKTEHDAGIPVINSLRRRGADEAEIQQLEQDIKDDDSRKQTSLATSMMNFNRE